MNPLIRKLQNFTSFTPAEIEALRDLVEPPVFIDKNEDLIRVGENPQGVNLVLEGFAYRYRTLPDGGKQIIGYLVPGDICDIRVFILNHMDHSIAALTDASVSILTPAKVTAIIEAHPRVMRALWWATLVEESITREWLLSMGQRSASERIAHLFCELFHRMNAVGLTKGRSIPFPLTQPELGESVGLSVVHVNRTLQELRRKGLIKLDGRVLDILDLAALERHALFDPAYLHLREQSDRRASAPFEDA